MKSFTIEQIKNYIVSKDSLGDVLYYLSEQAIEDANALIDESSEAYKEGIEEWQYGCKLRNPYRENCIEYKQYEAGWKYAMNNNDY